MDTAFFLLSPQPSKAFLLQQQKAPVKKAGAFSEMPKKQFAKYAFVFVSIYVFIYFRNGAVR